MRIIWFDSIWESILWTLRAWYWRYPVPLDINHWALTDAEDVPLYRKEALAIQRAWKFLGPFFASRGYTLYWNEPPDLFTLLPPLAPPAAINPSHPFSHRAFNEDEEIEFYFVSMRVWAARDADGRDVVIKLISDRTGPSNELKILQRLNSEPLRSDPRNHSIHALDFLSFDGLVFVVMPRWDWAFSHDFNTVAELMHLTEAFLEGVDFLHENRIAHCDFLEQNTGINVLADTRVLRLKGMRDPKTTQYAIYDFGYSLIYPYETVLEDVTETRFMGFAMLGIPEPTGPYNPFQTDVISVGMVIGRYVQPIMDLVPEIRPFFDSMTDNDPKKRFTARQALDAFRKIHSTLSPSQLSHPVGLIGSNVELIR